MDLGVDPQNHCIPWGGDSLGHTGMDWLYDGNDSAPRTDSRYRRENAFKDRGHFDKILTRIDRVPLNRFTFVGISQRSASEYSVRWGSWPKIFVA